jgi:hypothetical protein
MRPGTKQKGLPRVGTRRPKSGYLQKRVRQLMKKIGIDYNIKKRPGYQ